MKIGFNPYIPGLEITNSKPVKPVTINPVKVGINPDQLTLTTKAPAKTESKSFFSFLKRKEDVDIQVYNSFGNEKEVHIKGRVLEHEHFREVKKSNSWLANLIRNFRVMESDERSDVWLDITFNNRNYKVKSDEEGLFDLKISNFGKIQPGFKQVTVNVAAESQDKYTSYPSFGKVSIQTKNDQTFGVISDIDDTIKKSEVKSKWQLLKNTFLKNYETDEAIDGSAVLYNALEQQNDGKVDGDLYYISGSPINLNPRLSNFIKHNHFPEGSIALKNMGIAPGSDKLKDQVDYKLGKIRKVFDTYPQKKFILFGDSGEKDPEIYQQIAKEYPGRVLGIYINNVTNDSKDAPRFKNVNLTNNAAEAAQDLYQKGLIDAMALAEVQKSLQK